MKLVVTGARGVLGKQVCDALGPRDVEVVGIGRQDGDLLDPAAAVGLLADADVVVHLAAKVGGVDFLKRNTVSAYYDNISIGMNLVHACLHGKARRLVLIGTACSYPRAATLPLREEDLYCGLASGDTGGYGLAKATVSHVANQLLGAGGKEVVTLIPTNLYGPGDNFEVERSHVVASLLRKAIVASKQGHKSLEVWGDGTATRDLLHYRDAARAIAHVAVATGQHAGETINLGSGQETTIREIAQLIVAAVDPAMSVVFDPTKPAGVPRRVMSIAKAQSRIGFHPSIPLAEGIDETVAWIEAQQVWKDWVRAPQQLVA
jgi:GDP-L-fucose synthase